MITLNVLKDLVELINYEVAILVRRATTAAVEKQFGTLDRAHYLIMQQLEDHGAKGVKALADEFRLDISTVSRQTATMERRGYIRRVPDPEDGRASFFQLTDFGKEALEETRQARLTRYEELLRDWSTAERQKLYELLSRFNRTFID